MPCGETISRMTITANGFAIGGQVENLCKRYKIQLTGKATTKPFLEAGGKVLEGFQLRYIYILDKNCKLNCEYLPFSKIAELNAKMYKGERMNN